MYTYPCLAVVEHEQEWAPEHSLFLKVATIVSTWQPMVDIKYTPMY